MQHARGFAAALSGGASHRPLKGDDLGREYYYDLRRQSKLTKRHIKYFQVNHDVKAMTERGNLSVESGHACYLKHRAKHKLSVVIVADNTHAITGLLWRCLLNV